VVASGRSLALAPAIPTPTSSQARIRFTLPSEAAVTLAVYDLQGRRVATALDRAWRSAGPHEAHLRTDGWPAGCYLYRLEVGQARLARKLLVLR
jgi:hypothetical protein